VYIARLAANNAFKDVDAFRADDLGTYAVNNKVIVFGEPLAFTEDNIDRRQF
jgi:hypothetical protein